MTSEAESGPDRVATLLLKISGLTGAEDGSFWSPTLFKSETLSWSLFHILLWPSGGTWQLS